VQMGFEHIRIKLYYPFEVRIPAMVNGESEGM
jgi:hypothetical protein